MPQLETLAPFITGIVILQLSPGPDMLLILDRGIGRGMKVAFMTIAGIVLVAGAVQIGLLVLGLGIVVRDHRSATLALHLGGAAYLLYLGVRMMMTRPSAPQATDLRATDAATALREGALSSLTNPHTFLFLFVVLPQFVDPQAGHVWLQMLILGALHKLASLVTLGTVALAAQRIGRRIRRWPHLLSIQRSVCGLLMVGLSLTLAMRIPYSPDSEPPAIEGHASTEPMK